MNLRVIALSNSKNDFWRRRNWFKSGNRL
jgi:hypothetical protein